MSRHDTDTAPILRKVLDTLDGGGDLRSRLVLAVQPLVPIGAEELPSSVREEFRSLMADVARIPADSVGALRGTLDTMSDGLVCELIGQLRHVAREALAHVLHGNGGPSE